MNWFFTQPYSIAGLTFVCVAGIVALLGPAMTRQYSRRLRRRVAKNNSFLHASQLNLDHHALARPARLGGLTQLLIRGSNVEKEVVGPLQAAGYYGQTALLLFMGMRLMCMLCPLLLVPLLSSWMRLSNAEAVCVCVVFGFAGYFLPALWVSGHIAKRHQRLRNSLSDFLDLFVSCIESGATIPTLIPELSRELQSIHPELASEFLRSQDDMQLGATLSEAMADLANRTALEDLQAFSTLVRQSQNYGATLGGALRELSMRLRLQREYRAEERAQKASVQLLLPTLIFIFPAIFIVLAVPAGIKVHESFAKDSTPQSSSSVK